MNELLVFGELHKYLNGLGPMSCSLAAKSLVLGYKPVTFRGASKKFATLQGDKKHQCLVLHVDPGNPDSDKGKNSKKKYKLYYNLK